MNCWEWTTRNDRWIHTQTWGKKLAISGKIIEEKVQKRKNIDDDLNGGDVWWFDSGKVKSVYSDWKKEKNQVKL